METKEKKTPINGRLTAELMLFGFGMFVWKQYDMYLMQNDRVIVEN